MKTPVKPFAAALLLASAGSTFAEVRYVDVNSTNATQPYSSWATAATTIQDAVDAAVAGDEIVVTNGTYATGGRGGSRMEVGMRLNVRSINGPQFTIIDGGRSNRCVSLAADATLSGFTLTNGAAGVSGGAASNCTVSGNSGTGGHSSTLNNCTLSGNSGRGAARCTLNNCVLTGNTSDYGGGAALCTLNNCMLTSNSVAYGDGGGAYYCTLNNCTLTGNVAWEGNGGGAIGSMLNNCTVTGNSANHLTTIYYATGGGAYSCTLNNCILTDNSANEISGSGDPTFGGGAYNCALNYCIFSSNHASAEADYGPSSTQNHCSIIGPGFVDAAAGNLRLQSNSPCINAGRNAFAPAGPDLDGNPRIAGGTVDIGAYEFQSLDLLSVGVVSNQFGFNITGQSNWVIVLEASSDFTNWTPLMTNTLGGSPFPFRDLTPPNLPQRFYRARQP